MTEREYNKILKDIIQQGEKCPDCGQEEYFDISSCEGCEGVVMQLHCPMCGCYFDPRLPRKEEPLTVGVCGIALVFFTVAFWVTGIIYSNLFKSTLERGMGSPALFMLMFLLILGAFGSIVVYLRNR